MKRLILGILLNSLALFLAAHFISGFEDKGGSGGLLLAGLILSLINIIIKPIVVFLTLPLIILTLGLFYLLINGLLLLIIPFFIEGFTIEGIIPAIWGAIVLTLVNIFANWLLKPSTRVSFKKK